MEKFFEEIYYNFITLDLITLNKYILINIKVDFYKSKEFNNNISNYFKESVKYLRRNVLFVDVVIKFDYYFVNINK